MGILDSLSNKKEDKFVSLLIEQAEVTVEGLKLLETCILQLDETSIDQIRAKEYEAD